MDTALALPAGAEALGTSHERQGGQAAPFWYRTGDLAVWRDGGRSLELVGRADSQVKLHGVRVELGEIEGNLRRCSALVAGCAVCVADARAAALIVLQPEAALAWRAAAAEDGEPRRQASGRAVAGGHRESGACGQWGIGYQLWHLIERALRLHCEATLPRPMWPSRFVAVEALPLGPTHKLDRAALPGVLADATAQCDRRLAAAAAVSATDERRPDQGVPGGEMAAREAAGPPHPQLDRALLAVVAEVWAEALGLPDEHPLHPLHPRAAAPHTLHPAAATTAAAADFGQLGGDSLTALRAVRALHRRVRIGGRALPPLDSGMGDLGVITGVLAPAALLRRTRLSVYVAFLTENCVEVAAPATAASSVSATAAAVPSPAVPAAARTGTNPEEEAARHPRAAEVDDDAERWQQSAVELMISACQLGDGGAAVIRALLDVGALPEPIARVDAAVNARVGVAGMQPRKRRGGAGRRRVVQSPLHEAAKHGNLPAIRALLQAGASLTLATAGSRAL